MKIPGLFQAGDIFTSGAAFTQERGALVYYIASDFTPSSTQHLVDPRYLFKSCFVPVLEPRNHQEMHEAAGLAVEIARRLQYPGGGHAQRRPLPQRRPGAPDARDPPGAGAMPDSLRGFQRLPSLARKAYDTIMDERMPALAEMVEKSPLNRWERVPASAAWSPTVSATCTCAR